MIHIVKATEINDVDALALKAIRHMNNQGIPQWDERYPRAIHFMNDIRHASLYGYYLDGDLVGMACIDQTCHSSYYDLPWVVENSVFIHRVVVDPSVQRQGIAKQLFHHAETLANEWNATSIKVDTHPENPIMLQFLQRQGFQEIGMIDAIYRIGFEKKV
jgi:GNAT superfamily N-acetyltransferase